MTFHATQVIYRGIAADAPHLKTKFEQSSRKVRKHSGSQAVYIWQSGSLFRQSVSSRQDSKESSSNCCLGKLQQVQKVKWFSEEIEETSVLQV